MTYYSPAFAPGNVGDANAQKLQTLLDNESCIELPPSFSDGRLTPWTVSEVRLPDSHSVHVIGHGSIIRPVGPAGIEPWCAQQTEGKTAYHVVEGIVVEGKGEVGTAYQPSSQWALRDWGVSGMAGAIYIVQDKALFENFNISKCRAGFIVGPTAAHGGGHRLAKGRIQSCKYGWEVASGGSGVGGRIESWQTDRVHLDNLDWCFFRANSVQGDPPLLIDNLFNLLGAEFINIGRYHDPGPGGVVARNVFTQCNASFDTTPDDSKIKDFRDDNTFIGPESETGWKAA